MSSKRDSNSDEGRRRNQTSFTDAFKQQVMKAWQPVPTVNSTIYLFSFFTLFFIVFGSVLLVYSQKIIDYKEQYDMKCSGNLMKVKEMGDYQEGDFCQITINISEKMEGPVFVYYELENFYQNHRKYVKSKDVEQLQGKTYTKTSDIKSLCEPVLTNADVGREYSFDGTQLSPNGVAHPCGLIAKSYFTDEFFLRKSNSPFGVDYDQIIPVTSGDYFEISQKGIAWPSDKKHKYKNTKNANLHQWIDLDNNERFMVWMRTAALPKFRKIWGRIEQDLEPGQYTFDILNTFNVEEFDGKKTIVLSTANPFGGRNMFLAVAYLVIGCICFLVTVGFIIKKFAHKKQKQQ